MVVFLHNSWRMQLAWAQLKHGECIIEGFSEDVFHISQQSETDARTPASLNK
jgi:hypothetical protein